MKRKQYLPWLMGVFGIFGTIYGTYLLIYHYNHGNGLNVASLILLILGGISLAFTIALVLSVYLANKKNEKKKEEAKKIEEEKPEVVETPVKEEKKETPKRKEYPYVEPKERVRSSYSYSAPSTVYVKQVGYGPLLRVEGNRILDMRSNTYYRIENNMVNQEGSGPRYEIRGNQIRDAFGGYLFEISGSNINKVFFGFYASISGNYITLFDSSKKFELTDSLSKKQLLVVAALIF